jgi:hypothetical protein
VQNETSANVDARLIHVLTGEFVGSGLK